MGSPRQTFPCLWYIWGDKLMRLSGFYYIAFLFGLFSCANVVTPSGGEKDVSPPLVIESAPPNFSLNFKSKKVILSFDEYVNLQDPNVQIIISPPLQKFPDFRIKGKNIIVTLPEKLDSSATYTINFGEAIRDVNESNVLKNYQYVFSTGRYLDSLFIAGKVIDAFDNAAAENVLVMLYKDINDSVVHTQKPYYFTRTLKDGSFTIGYIKYGTYKLFCLEDQNFNYLYDLPNEKVGFVESAILIQDSMERFHISMFMEEQKILKLYDADYSKSGRIRLVYSLPVENFDVSLIEPTDNYPARLVEFNDTRDTILIWYNYNLYEEQSLLLMADTLIDTVLVTADLFTKDSADVRLPKIDFAGGLTQAKTLDIGNPLVLVFNRPVTGFDLDRITLIEDTLNKVVQPVMAFIGEGQRKLEINYSWKPNLSYQLIIPDSAFYDYYGTANDSTVLNYISKSEDDYASLLIKFTGGRSSDIVQLMSNAGKIIREIKRSEEDNMHFNLLAPGDYKLKIIKDKNMNGQWDTGNYLLKIQPEETYVYPEKISLRANWEIEIEVSMAE